MTQCTSEYMQKVQTILSISKDGILPNFFGTTIEYIPQDPQGRDNISIVVDRESGYSALLCWKGIPMYKSEIKQIYRDSIPAIKPEHKRWERATLNFPLTCNEKLTVDKYKSTKLEVFPRVKEGPRVEGDDRVLSGVSAPVSPLPPAASDSIESHKRWAPGGGGRSDSAASSKKRHRPKKKEAEKPPARRTNRKARNFLHR